MAVPCGFDTRHYFDCLIKARDELGYQVKRVCDYSSNDDKVILLRHDIDLSLDYAHRLATYENRFGFASSYYVHLHSETYNALSPQSIEVIRKIEALGHEIGLHYDSKHHIPGESLFISKMLKGLQTYTLHNASYENAALKFQHLRNPNDWDLKYISDSGKNWREGCMCQWIGKEDKLHILTHPIWWIKKGVRDKIIFEAYDDAKAVIGKGFLRYKKVLQDYCRDLKIDY